MGIESIVYGVIVGSGYHVDRRDALHELNEAAVSRLPEGDDWPFLTRSMFSFVKRSERPFGLYKSQVIHLGASFKGVEDEWLGWFEKFENFLRTVYFDSARLHLLTEQGGDFVYSWKTQAPKDFYASFPPMLPMSWSLIEPENQIS